MSEITLTQADHGRNVTVQPGDEIVVRLPENPTTGYRWQADRQDPALELISDGFKLGTGPQIGSGGTREFRFRARGAGEIALRHWQAWEGEGTVTERFRVGIVAPD